MIIERYTAAETLPKTLHIDSDIESARWLTSEPDEVYELLSPLEPKDLSPEQSDQVRQILQQTIDQSAERSRDDLQRLQDLFRNKADTPVKTPPHKKAGKTNKPVDQYDFNECLRAIDKNIQNADFTEIGAYIDRLEDLEKGSLAFRKYFEAVAAAYPTLAADAQQALQEEVGKTVNFTQEDHPKDSHITFTIAKWYETIGNIEGARQFFNATSSGDFNGKKKAVFKQNMTHFLELHPLQG